jgi:hypothetical protein
VSISRVRGAPAGRMLASSANPKREGERHELNQPANTLREVAPKGRRQHAVAPWLFKGLESVIACIAPNFCMLPPKSTVVTELGKGYAGYVSAFQGLSLSSV